MNQNLTLRIGFEFGWKQLFQRQCVIPKTKRFHRMVFRQSRNSYSGIDKRFAIGIEQSPAQYFGADNCSS